MVISRSIRSRRCEDARTNATSVLCQLHGRGISKDRFVRSSVKLNGSKENLSFFLTSVQLRTPHTSRRCIGNLRPLKSAGEDFQPFALLRIKRCSNWQPKAGVEGC